MGNFCIVPLLHSASDIAMDITPSSAGVFNFAKAGTMMASRAIRYNAGTHIGRHSITHIGAETSLVINK